MWQAIFVPFPEDPAQAGLSPGPKSTRVFPVLVLPKAGLHSHHRNFHTADKERLWSSCHYRGAKLTRASMCCLVLTKLEKVLRARWVRAFSHGLQSGKHWLRDCPVPFFGRAPPPWPKLNAGLSRPLSAPSVSQVTFIIYAFEILYYFIT